VLSEPKRRLLILRIDHWEARGNVQRDSIALANHARANGAGLIAMRAPHRDGRGQNAS
jgi:hypothetical protein